jgi:hypothetical protein
MSKLLYVISSPQDVEQVAHRTAQASEAAPAMPEHREQG